MSEIAAQQLRQQLAQLSADGAAQHHPLRFHQLRALLGRAALQPEPLQQRLYDKAEMLMQQLQVLPVTGNRSTTPSHKPGQSALSQLVTKLTPTESLPVDNARGVALDEALQQMELEVLAALNQQQTGIVPMAVTQAVSTADTAPRNAFTELRSSRLLRQARVSQGANRLVEQAIANAPENPGPVNPEMLTIRALGLMRDLAPSYLNRFVSYIDTLFWLEQAAGEPETKKPATKAKRGKN